MLDSNDNGRPAARPIPAALSAMLRASDGILDMLPIATFICDARGTILQYNRRAAEIWGRAPEPGQTHEQFTESSRFFRTRRYADGALDGVRGAGDRKSGARCRAHRRAHGRHATSRVGQYRSAAQRQGRSWSARSTAFSTSPSASAWTPRSSIRACARSSRNSGLAATYEHAAIGISEIAPDGSFLRVNEAICAITGYSREHLLANKLFTHTHPDDADADREGFRKQVAGELEFYSVEKRFIRKDGRVIWLSVRSSPVRADDGHLLYVVRVVQDITERKAAEQRQKLLIDELNHRVKNTLATVQSLASQTARGAPTPAAFREGFEGRLIALSKAHDQLTMHHWESADLRELLSGSLAPYTGAGPERIVLRGEDIVLRPRAVLTLAMAFHELTTNAAKYGALSVPGGRIEIRWQPVRGDDDGRRCCGSIGSSRAGRRSPSRSNAASAPS